MSDLPGGTPPDPVAARSLEGTWPSAPFAPGGGVAPGRALVIAAAFLFAQLAVGTVVGTVAGLCYGIGRGQGAQRIMEEIDRVVVLPSAAAAMIGGGLVAFVMTRRVLPGSLRDGALRPVGWCAAKKGHVVPAACLGVVLAAFYLFVLGRVFPPAPGQEWGPVTRAMAAPGWSRLAWAILVIGVAPPAEEFLFRGVLWSGLARGMTAAGAAAVVTLLFLLGHITEIRTYWPAWFVISALGLLAIALRVRGESLVPAVVLHASYNAFLVAAVSLA